VTLTCAKENRRHSSPLIRGPDDSSEAFPTELTRRWQIIGSEDEPAGHLHLCDDDTFMRVGDASDRAPEELHSTQTRQDHELKLLQVGRTFNHNGVFSELR
jgi:hypothetical protein